MTSSKNCLPPEIAGYNSPANPLESKENASSLSPAVLTDTPVIPLAEVEKATIENALRTYNGNIIKAAAQLEIAPSTLYRKIKRWEEK
jgi:two-component system repressor protein LuxO